MYTAARTKLINDNVENWLELDNAQSNDEWECQIVNLGAGLDTRPYWMESLKKCKFYWEIDTASVMTHKQKVLQHVKESGKLPEDLCTIKTISMTFLKNVSLICLLDMAINLKVQLVG